MKSIATVLYVLAVVANVGWSQVAKPIPQTAPANDKIEFRFNGQGSMINGLCIPVTIGKNEHWFQVDTGCSGTVVEMALTRELGPSVGASTVSDFYGRQIAAQVYRAVPMKALGHLLLDKDATLAATDHGMMPKSVEGTLGRNVLSNYVVRFDFLDGALEFIQPKSFQPPSDIEPMPMVDTPSGVGVLIDFAGVAAVPVTIDSGYDGAFCISPAILAKFGPQDFETRKSASPLTAVGGREQDPLDMVWIKRNWSLGGAVFDNLWMDQAPHNLMGLKLLSNFVVTMDFPDKKVYFESIRSEQRSGIRVALKSGRPIVTAVGKPAIAAGVLTGDEIVAVNAKEVGAIGPHELASLRESLAAIKVTLTLKHGTETKEATVTGDVLPMYNSSSSGPAFASPSTTPATPPAASSPHP